MKQNRNCHWLPIIPASAKRKTSCFVPSYSYHSSPFFPPKSPSSPLTGPRPFNTIVTQNIYNARNHAVSWNLLWLFQPTYRDSNHDMAIDARAPHRWDPVHVACLRLLFQGSHSRRSSCVPRIQECHSKVLLEMLWLLSAPRKDLIQFWPGYRLPSHGTASFLCRPTQWLGASTTEIRRDRWWERGRLDVQFRQSGYCPEDIISDGRIERTDHGSGCDTITAQSLPQPQATDGINPWISASILEMGWRPIYTYHKCCNRSHIQQRKPFPTPHHAGSLLHKFWDTVGPHAPHSHPCANRWNLRNRVSVSNTRLAFVAPQSKKFETSTCVPLLACEAKLGIDWDMSCLVLCDSVIYYPNIFNLLNVVSPNSCSDIQDFSSSAKTRALKSKVWRSDFKSKATPLTFLTTSLAKPVPQKLTQQRT